MYHLLIQSHFMKKTNKSTQNENRSEQIAKIERCREKELKSLYKKIREEKIAFTISFFENQGKQITREEAITLLKEIEGSVVFKEHQKEVQPLIEKNVHLETKLESLQSLIEEKKVALRNIEDEIKKNK
jgi:hypothetical protein